jgi:hypothetical protein
LAFKKVSFLNFKYGAKNSNTKKHERKEKLIKIRAGIPTSTVAIEVTSANALLIPMDLADFNVSKALLFLI